MAGNLSFEDVVSTLVLMHNREIAELRDERDQLYRRVQQLEAQLASVAAALNGDVVGPTQSTRAALSPLPSTHARRSPKQSSLLNNDVKAAAIVAKQTATVVPETPVHARTRASPTSSPQAVSTGLVSRAARREQSSRRSATTSSAIKHSNLSRSVPRGRVSFATPDSRKWLERSPAASMPRLSKGGVGTSTTTSAARKSLQFGDDSFALSTTDDDDDDNDGDGSNNNKNNSTTKGNITAVVDDSNEQGDRNNGEKTRKNNAVNEKVSPGPTRRPAKRNGAVSDTQMSTLENRRNAVRSPASPSSRTTKTTVTTTPSGVRGVGVRGQREREQLSAEELESKQTRFMRDCHAKLAAEDFEALMRLFAQAGEGQLSQEELLGKARILFGVSRRTGRGANEELFREFLHFM